MATTWEIISGSALDNTVMPDAEAAAASAASAAASEAAAENAAAETTTSAANAATSASAAATSASSAATSAGQAADSASSAATSATEASDSASAAAASAISVAALGDQALTDPVPAFPMKPLLWWSASGQRLHSDMTFARASAGTIFDSHGELVDVSSGEPRWSREAVKGSSPGLRIEPAGTNLTLHKRDLTQAAWVKTDCTAAKTERGLDGVASSASRLTATASDATCLQAITSASASRAAHVWLRRITGTGSVSLTVDGGLTWTSVDVRSSDWRQYRIPKQTLANPSVGVKLGASGDEIGVDYFECEATRWTSPKSTSAETRAQDELTMPLPADFYGNGALEGTVFLRVRVWPQGTSGALLQIDDGTTSNRMGLTISSSDLPNMVSVSGGSTTVNATAGGAAVGEGEELVLAMRFKADDWRMAIRGRTAVTDTAGAVPVGLTTLRVGRQSGTSAPGALDLLEFALFPKALTDAEMDSLVNSATHRAPDGRSVLVAQFGGEGNDWCFVRTPDSYRVNGSAHPMVILNHGNGWTMNGSLAKANFSDKTQFGVDTQNGGAYLDTTRSDYVQYSSPLIEALLDAGFVVCGAQNYGDALYGNNNCRNAVVDFWEWMCRNFNVARRCHMIGASNGMMATLNACHLLGTANVASIVGLYPLCSLLDHYVGYASHQAGIEAAYGGGPWADKAAMLADPLLWTHCPVNDYVVGTSDSTTQKTAPFPPMMLIASGGDTVTAVENNAEKLRDLCERSRLSCDYTDIDPGGVNGYGHGDWHHFKEAEIVAFLQANK